MKTLNLVVVVWMMVAAGCHGSLTGHAEDLDEKLTSRESFSLEAENLSEILEGLEDCGSEPTQSDGETSAPDTTQESFPNEGETDTSDSEPSDEGSGTSEATPSALSAQSSAEAEVSFSRSSFTLSVDGEEVLQGTWEATDGDTIEIEVDGESVTLDVEIDGDVIIFNLGDDQGSSCSGGDRSSRPGTTEETEESEETNRADNTDNTETSSGDEPVVGDDDESEGGVSSAWTTRSRGTGGSTYGYRWGWGWQWNRDGYRYQYGYNYGRL